MTSHPHMWSARKFVVLGCRSSWNRRLPVRVGDAAPFGLSRSCTGSGERIERTVSFRGCVSCAKTRSTCSIDTYRISGRNASGAAQSHHERDRANQSKGRLILRIRNARKWSDQGVRGLAITIADNGSGISPEAQKRLGEPFFTTKGQAGTGLGLWVTRSILSRYGGSLQVRSSTSSRRHGTVFSLFIPTNMRPVPVSAAGAASALSWSRLRFATSRNSFRHLETSDVEDDELVAG